MTICSTKTSHFAKYPFWAEFPPSKSIGCSVGESGEKRFIDGSQKSEQM